MATRIEENLDNNQTAGVTSQVTTDSDGTSRTQKRPPSETSPASDLQAEQKKLHREDSSSSNIGAMGLQEADQGSEGVSGSGNEVNSRGMHGKDNAVRQKLYADLLSRSMANTTGASTSSLEVDTFGVEDPSDSLLLKLLHLGDKVRSSDDANSGTKSNTLVLTPMITKLFSPEKSQNVFDGKEEQSETAKCVAENNLYLKAMARALDNMSTNFATKIDQVEKLIDNSVSEINNKLEANDCEHAEIKSLIGKSYEYTDDRFHTLKSAIPVTIDEIYTDLERKFHENHTEHKMSVGNSISKVETDLGGLSLRVSTIERVFQEKLSMCENKQTEELAEVRRQLVKLSANQCKGHSNDVVRELKDYKQQVEVCKEKMREYDERLAATNRRLDEALSKINQSQNNGSHCGPQFDTMGLSNREIHQQRTLDDYGERLSNLEYNQRRNTFAIKIADMYRRKQNVVIDQLGEITNETIVERINLILDNSLSKEDREKVVVRNAYRIGKQRTGQRLPRKVMIQLDNPIGKEIIIKNAGTITRWGNDGKTYYINEDQAETDRRMKNDLFKYTKYLEERQHKVERENDFFIIDGTKWHINQLNDLPEGMRLMDSRTRFKRGTVAFQSALSPLSNLFHCRLKYNGVVYNSVEQAYQCLKCLHHGKLDLATDIKHEPDPYKILNMADFREDQEWLNQRLDVLEQLVRFKHEQCPIFRDTLKRTYGYRLVENTWSHFWGSACPFLHDALWDGTYKGHNHFGRLLEHIRETS